MKKKVPFRPMRPDEVLDRVKSAPPIVAEAPADLGGGDFTSGDRGDEWHQEAKDWADKQVARHGSMVTTIKTGKIPDGEGWYPATAFLRTVRGGLPRLHFSGKPTARGWLIVLRKGPNPEFDVEKGSPAPLDPAFLGVEA